MTTTLAATAPTTSLCQMLRLCPNQSQMLYWPAGTAITVLRGGVWLSETPRWLGEQMVRPHQRVQAHATHVMAEAGWVVLRADGDTVLQVTQAEPAAPAVVQPVWSSIAAVWRKAGRHFARSPARLA